MSRTGLTNFGDSSFRDGLEIVCAGLESERVRFGGRDRLANEIVSHLANRLRVVDWHARHPAARQRSIKAPIVILGLPRTGTTAVSYLLDRDPQWRSLLNWEATQSVPPPTDATLRSDPRCTELLEFQQALVGTIDPPPPHWEWADGPTECTFLLAQDFKTVMWESRVPNPDYRDYITTCDMTSAYDYHRAALQVLGSETTGDWVLKMPAHAYFIEPLLAAYPDARIIWTHRDPSAATASFLNLIAFSHHMTLGTPDIEWIANTYPDRLVEQVMRPMRALAGRDVFHLHYSQYLGDPLAEMTRLYKWLGLDLTDDVETSMRSWLHADPLEVSRRGNATLADFGIDRNELLDRFSLYTSTYDVEIAP